MDHWDLVPKINAKLCQLFSQSHQLENQEMFDQVLATIEKALMKGGSLGKKKTEVEHLEILADALAIEKTTETEAIRNDILKLKGELERMT